jgi:hypothetical protein
MAKRLTSIQKSLNHNDRISTLSFWLLSSINKNNVNGLKNDVGSFL